MNKKNLPLVISVVLMFYFSMNSVFSYQWIQALENKAYDWRLGLSSANTVDDRVVILDIDEKSLEQIGQWPWPRDVIADIIEKLYRDYEIKIIGFDVVFAEPDVDPAAKAIEKLAKGPLKDNSSFQSEYRKLRKQFDRDRQFARVLKKYPSVMGVVFDQPGITIKGALPLSLGEMPEEIVKSMNIHQPRGHVANLEILQKASGIGGFFDNPTLDADGVFRRVPLLQVYEGQLYPSLALATATAYLDNPPFNMQINKSGDGSYYLKSVRLGEREIPIGKSGALLVPYRGGKGSFPYVSAIDVLNGEVDKKVLEGRALLLGTSAPGLLDLRTTPLQKAYPGVEVHANIVSGIIDGSIKTQPTYVIGIEFLLLLAVGIIIIFLSQISPGKFVLLNLAISLVLFAINYFAWNGNLVLPLMSPFILQACLFVLFMSWGLLVESREKKAITKLFGQYVPPELVDEMAERPQDISLEGQNKEMTVLFSDVRGFTTISEGLAPNELTQLMNDMLTPMTEIIHQTRGTIDKYMGDAIMAFWGAPLDDPEHAKNALITAVKIVDVLPEINKRFAEKGWPEINVGVGLNTGEMNVGNMGSQFRMAYTVLGDAVNLGSRLEGLTKQYGVNIIISETTKDAVEGLICRELDRVRVKGKDEPVTIYEPVGMEGEVAEDVLQPLNTYHEALALYREQQWDKALAMLIELNTRVPKKIHTVYMDRIEAYKEDPPGADWDGVFTHTSK